MPIFFNMAVFLKYKCEVRKAHKANKLKLGSDMEIKKLEIKKIFKSVYNKLLTYKLVYPIY